MLRSPFRVFFIHLCGYKLYFFIHGCNFWEYTVCMPLEGFLACLAYRSSFEPMVPNSGIWLDLNLLKSTRALLQSHSKGLLRHLEGEKLKTGTSCFNNQKCFFLAFQGLFGL